jgi:hypothetical protein
MINGNSRCNTSNADLGGHLKPDPWSRAGNVIDQHGKEAAEEVSSFEIRHIKEIGDLVKRENIDCDFVVTRATDVCLYDKARDELKAKLDRLNEAGLSVDDVFYNPEKIAEGVCSSIYTQLNTNSLNQGFRCQRRQRLFHTHCRPRLAVQAGPSPIESGG